MSFRRYAAERIVASVVVLWLGVSLIFLAFFVLPPGDAARRFAGKGAAPKTIAQVRKELHLDRSRFDQYGAFFDQLFLHADLGHSWYNRESVGDIVGDAAPVTGSLAGGAMILALVLGVLFGLTWTRRSRCVGLPARWFVYSAVSLSPLLLSSMFVQIDVRAEIVPLGGYCDFFYPENGPDLPHCTNPADWANRLILPWLALGLPLAAVYVRIVRALRHDVDTADDKRSARRQARVTALRLLVFDASWIMGATFFVEYYFGIPGLSRTVFSSLRNYDLPTMQGVLAFVLFIQVAIYLVGNLVGGAISKEWRRT